MNVTRLAAVVLLGSFSVAPLTLAAQESHADAKAQVEAHDAKHHNKAKLVGGGAAGGAATGAVVGGPVGAVVGAGIGAGAGVIGNKARKHHSIKQRQKYASPNHY
ncbi:hypothetical protein ACFQBQ_12610 [Granulicella cerasi]|uniref:Glycine zipper domain-containing protein n=1 Tax=Granulicella cerasi TaxID=741063 RepID=A0ABW1ZAD9_9BACT|nr:hypothetical protein [Granulicella cerasi]